MSRKNHNSVKGRNSGKKNRQRDEFEPVDGEAIFFLINEDAQVLHRAFR